MPVPRWNSTNKAAASTACCGQFVDGRPRINRWRSMSEIPAHHAAGRKMSKELKRRGFRFIGPTVMYAHMQATGMVNDHLASPARATPK
jgi:DNA-3-methyladenine glycosylase I